jgi:uncharacterized membrane protein
MDAKQSRIRHIAKTATWRVIGTVDTFLVSWWVSGDPFVGFEIGLFELITKTLLYYFHERAWFRFGRLGREDKHDDKNTAAQDS